MSILNWVLTHASFFNGITVGIFFCQIVQWWHTRKMKQFIRTLEVEQALFWQAMYESGQLGYAHPEDDHETF